MIEAYHAPRDDRFPANDYPTVRINLHVVVFSALRVIANAILLGMMIGAACRFL